MLQTRKNSPSTSTPTKIKSMYYALLNISRPMIPDQNAGNNSPSGSFYKTSNET